MYRAILLLLLLCSATKAQTVFDLAALPDGTVLQSRNADERLNTSPGFWNHLAIVSNGHIVEAQEGQGVIQTSFQTYLARPYSRIRAFTPVSLEEGERIADTSETLNGKPFRLLSSLPGKDRPRAMDRGMNCDSVVRFSARQATGKRLRRMRIPDRMSIMVSRGVVNPPITLR